MGAPPYYGVHSASSLAKTDVEFVKGRSSASPYSSRDKGEDNNKNNNNNNKFVEGGQFTL